jgi:hypothetical protein
MTLGARSVYIDHILVSWSSSQTQPGCQHAELDDCLSAPEFQYPTLTHEGFVTEVHHVNGLGENAGVVYAEMQARENQAGDLMALKYVGSTVDYR